MFKNKDFLNLYIKIISNFGYIEWNKNDKKNNLIINDKLYFILNTKFNNNINNIINNNKITEILNFFINFPLKIINDKIILNQLFDKIKNIITKNEKIKKIFLIKTGFKDLILYQRLIKIFNNIEINKKGCTYLNEKIIVIYKDIIINVNDINKNGLVYIIGDTLINYGILLSKLYKKRT